MANKDAERGWFHLLASILEWRMSNITDDFRDFAYSLQAKLLDGALRWFIEN
jgi:hypothetical protein